MVVAIFHLTTAIREMKGQSITEKERKREREREKKGTKEVYEWCMIIGVKTKF